MHHSAVSDLWQVGHSPPAAAAASTPNGRTMSAEHSRAGQYSFCPCAASAHQVGSANRDGSDYDTSECWRKSGGMMPGTSILGCRSARWTYWRDRGLGLHLPQLLGGRRRQQSIPICAADGPPTLRVWTSASRSLHGLQWKGLTAAATHSVVFVYKVKLILSGRAGIVRNAHDGHQPRAERSESVGAQAVSAEPVPATCQAVHRCGLLRIQAYCAHRWRQLRLQRSGGRCIRSAAAVLQGLRVVQ